MLFSSITFLYVFLPAVLLIYFLVPARGKNFVLLAASLIFYCFGEQLYTILLLASSLSDYFHSLYIERHRGEKKAKIALISSIIINLAMLCVFKYADFFIGSLNALTGGRIPLPGIELPLGISFFTFQTMSYTIDVYRGDVTAEKSVSTLATYVCLFPQLVAGPIVRYQSVQCELHQRRHTLSLAAEGVGRFVLGLSKKVLLANQLGELCAVFRASSDQSVLFYWVYAAAFTLQIYFDFSGYSDMAIGLGKLLGFHFPENFNYPYISRSITEFWRRWHITLSTWFRDYVYIPLGGNRAGPGKWARNLLLVWLLTGLWHGAQWNFVLWGAGYGILLLLEKRFWGNALKKAPPVLGWMYTMGFTLLGFVLFHANGLSGALSDFRGMFGGLDIPLVSQEALYQLRNYGVLLALAAVGATPFWRYLLSRAGTTRAGQIFLTAAQPAALTLLLLASTAYLVDGSFNPFLYFRF